MGKTTAYYYQSPQHRSTNFTCSHEILSETQPQSNNPGFVYVITRMNYTTFPSATDMYGDKYITLRICRDNRVLYLRNCSP